MIQQRLGRVDLGEKMIIAGVKSSSSHEEPGFRIQMEGFSLKWERDNSSFVMGRKTEYVA